MHIDPNKYKDHYACFECRKAFRISPFREWVPPEVHFGAVIPEVKCPDCAQPMVSMGHNFKAPRRQDTKQWETIRLLLEAGIPYYPDQWHFANPPTSPAKVAAFVERRRVSCSLGRTLAAQFARVGRRGRRGSK